MDIREIVLAKKLFNLQRELKESKRLRLYHENVIELAELFQGYPICDVNSADFRLRMSPWVYLFGRTFLGIQVPIGGV